MKNTDYLFRGYNIFLADPTPKDGEIDPGFEAHVFRATWDQKKESTDGRFVTPDGYRLTMVESCSMSMKSTVITGETSFQNTFSAEVGVEGTIKGIKFSASKSFKNIYEETNKNQKTFIYSRADCRVYNGEMDPYIPPKFDLSFLEAINQLSRGKSSFQQDPNRYWNFINNFGTHYMYEVNMGSRMGAVSKTSTKEVEKMMTNEVAFEGSVGVEDVLEVKNKISNKTQVKSKFFSKMEDIKAFSIGAKPDADLNPNTWARQSILEPMPITYKVRPIIDILFQSENIDFKLRSQLDENTDLNFVTNNLKLAYDNYCQNYLLAKNMVRSCTEVSKDIELKKVVMGEINSGTFVYLQNMETEKCITSVGTPGEAQPYLSLPCGSGNILKQGFYFDFRNNNYIITQRGNIGCMDLSHGNNDENGKINMWHCNLGDHQKFSAILNDNGSYTLKTVRGKCLQVREDNKANNADIVQNTCNLMPGQEWRAIPIRDLEFFDVNDYEGSLSTPEENKPRKEKREN